MIDWFLSGFFVALGVACAGMVIAALLWIVLQIIDLAAEIKYRLERVKYRLKRG